MEEGNDQALFVRKSFMNISIFKLFALLLTISGVIFQSVSPHMVVQAAQSDLVPKLTGIKSWAYQLQKIDPGIIARSKEDLVVIDYSRTGAGADAFSPAELSQMKRKIDGSRRFVLAYLSIGEAEDYRFYWQSDWRKKRPDWLLPENPDWPGNYPVKYWHADWQKIIHTYLEHIIKVGFDGVYLDRVDSFEEFSGDAKAKARMISFVRDLAHRANRQGRKFYIVPQNGEDLLHNKSYRNIISAIGKEDFLFGIKRDEQPNPKAEISWSKKALLLARKAGLPVLAIEYLTNIKKLKQASKKFKSLGFVATFSNRELDQLSRPFP